MWRMWFRSEHPCEMSLLGNSWACLVGQTRALATVDPYFKGRQVNFYEVWPKQFYEEGFPQVALAKSRALYLMSGFRWS